MPLLAEELGRRAGRRDAERVDADHLASVAGRRSAPASRRPSPACPTSWRWRRASRRRRRRRCRPAGRSSRPAVAPSGLPVIATQCRPCSTGLAVRWAGAGAVTLRTAHQARTNTRSRRMARSSGTGSGPAIVAAGVMAATGPAVSRQPSGVVRPRGVGGRRSGTGDQHVEAVLELDGVLEGIDPRPPLVVDGVRRRG